MIIFAMRHAEADSNLNPLEKGRQGDSKVRITSEGWRQSIQAGDFFASYLSEQGITSWPRFWVSPLLRPRQTLSGLFHGMGSGAPAGEPRVFEDSNLAEQSFGALPLLQILKEHPSFSHIPPEELERNAEFLTLLSQALYKQEPYLAAPPLGEAPFQLLARFNAVSQSILRDEKDGVDCHFVATHGAMIKTMLLKLNHIPMENWRDIPTPNNIDIFRIDLEPGTGRVRSCLRIYDGKAGQADNFNPVAHLKPRGFKDLPDVPDEFKIK